MSQPFDYRLVLVYISVFRCPALTQFPTFQWGFETDNLMPQSHGKDVLVMFNLTMQKRKPALRIQ
jgi:hypothetical protein